MELKLERCTIRSWQPGDEAALVRHANNRKIWRNVRDRFPHPYTLADAEAWIAFAGAQDPCINFAIVVAGEAAGGIGFVLKDDVDRRSAEIGYWLGEAFWGRGIATEAVRAMTAYMFEHFDLCRIQAMVFEWNKASMRVLEKAGYVCEARLRGSATKDGQTIDDFIYAFVRPERFLSPAR
ncbi:MAG: GNAT family N-acetyltransferase [candidate division KSB1 bacterium]|nr:GNAT family N-acetyltransferase [candidate division KSB1 bacterium]MDZ7274432.1 GNAT family N-acetyltransferase [candidate division KSB1 bacterium]MDZ7284906.1 GNAT family N-acetyltransferase [candidate division KSB1 bacterium]MDZ7297673.1 GNAT family N-acetyltransferase [candidate division KSB1 bacterium]MDZ7305903.1 GNAT family N-acetyltransferase [candidate division KSB1 bacterium]